MCRVLSLQFVQIGLQTVEALLPETAVVLQPIRGILERRRIEAARAPLRVSAAADEPGALQHLEMLRDGRQTQVERLGQRGDRCLARDQSRQNGAPGRVGERGESAAELIGHSYFTV